MISTNIIKFLVLKHIKLDSEKAVVRIAIVGEIEETQMLRGTCAIDSNGGCEEESKSMAREAIRVRGDRENEGG